MTVDFENYPCTKCGACCRKFYVSSYNNFTRHILNKELGEDLPPLPTKEDGSCYHLQEDNTCGIYDSRPVICRLTKDTPFLGANSMQEKLGYSDLEYHDSLVDMCNRFVTMYKMDPKFRIATDSPDRVKQNSKKVMDLWVKLAQKYSKRKERKGTEISIKKALSLGRNRWLKKRKK